MRYLCFIVISATFILECCLFSPRLCSGYFRFPGCYKGNMVEELRKWFPCSISLHFSNISVCFLVLTILNKAWQELRKLFFSLSNSPPKVLMQWSLGLASLLWVWQFLHYLLPFSFPEPFFYILDDLHEFHCSVYDTTRVTDLVGSLFRCVYCSKGCLLGSLRFSILPFGFFSLLPRTVHLFYAWNFYYVLLSVLGVFFLAPFFSNASVFVPFELSTLWFLTGIITNIHFNLLTAL